MTKNIFNPESKYLRRGVHEVLEKGEDAKEPLWNNLKVAMTHIIHKINVSHVSKYGDQRHCVSEDWG